MKAFSEDRMKYSNLIDQMTLEEKASLTSGKDFWRTESIARLEIPSIFLADGPHGIRKQAAAADHLGLNASIPATCFPTAATMAGSWDPELGEELASALGKEARSQHVNVLLGPGLNMKRNPLCGRNFEYFSEDPYLVGKMAAAYVRGIQSQGVSACIKHFACNNQETRRMVYDSIVDERALREIYLTGFEIAVKEGHPLSIMTSYNRVNGDYANENHHLLQDILREEWGYDGLVITDWGGNNLRVKALIEGNALEMPTTQGETNEEIVAAVKSGELDEKFLDRRVDELLNVIFRTEEAMRSDEKIDEEKHHLLAQKCAEESMILLKNEHHLLPLKKEDRVAFIGDFFENPRFQGAGSSIVNPTKKDTVLDLANQYGFESVGYAKGYNRYGKKSEGLMKKALKLAEKADVILYAMGLDEVTEAEGMDRKGIKIAENQILLLKKLHELNKPVVVVLSAGAIVDLSWDEYADALLHTYLSGQAGAGALLRVLSGRVNPSGKLAETYPARYEDVSSSTTFPSGGMTVEYRESIYVGYRYFDKIQRDVKYPFGYGLSYTEFSYRDLKIDENGVSFTIRNDGNFDGKEVAQLYIGMENSEIFRAEKELKGFVKVFLKAGESKEVTIPFDDKTFRYFNVGIDRWEEEKGTYRVLIGASSRDIRLEGKIDRAGTGAENPYDGFALSSYFSGKITEVDDRTFEKLIGRELPSSSLNFYKKNRIHVDYNTTVMDLRYAPGWTGRVFAGALRFAERFLRLIGKRTLANTLVMGMFHNPMRGLSRMSGGMISWGQLNGLMTMFNGHFFRGLSIYFRAGKEKKRRQKRIKALEEGK